MPRATHPCGVDGCVRNTSYATCFLHSPSGGRKASDWLLDFDVYSDVGKERHQGPKSFRMFCLMCARDWFADHVPNNGMSTLWCGHCQGRVFVEADELRPSGANGTAQRVSVGRRAPHFATLDVRDGEQP